LFLEKHNSHGNIVGISENSPDEKDKKILKSIKKEIISEEEDKKG